LLTIFKYIISVFYVVMSKVSSGAEYDAGTHYPCGGPEFTFGFGCVIACL
jgi:hypothetical protein